MISVVCLKEESKKITDPLATQLTGLFTKMIVLFVSKCFKSIETSDNWYKIADQIYPEMFSCQNANSRHINWFQVLDSGIISSIHNLGSFYVVITHNKLISCDNNCIESISEAKIEYIFRECQNSNWKSFVKTWGVLFWLNYQFR